MNMTTLSFMPARWLGVALVGITFAAGAVSPAQVRQRLADGEKITFVDVRNQTLFQAGHIPGAIHIPAQLVPAKQLPPLGNVVVYDGGLGETSATAAASVLNQRPGFSAEALDGGLAAWTSTRADTTQPGGMQAEGNPEITYAQLQQVQGADVVLVDLRQPAATNAPLTDLTSEFPKARVVQSPFAGSIMQSKVAVAATPPLLVLVDNGDGRAEAMARTLKANGVTRYVILAGGEQILAVHGQAGLQRIGSSVNVKKTISAQPVVAP